jgi:hypothetical protein
MITVETVVDGHAAPTYELRLFFAVKNGDQNLSSGV